MDVVVQLAVDPRPDASWESLLGSNIVGPRNVLEAARRARGAIWCSQRDVVQLVPAKPVAEPEAADCDASAPSCGHRRQDVPSTVPQAPD